MAPDRRFGLPHPFDAEPPEESSGRGKTGFWETVKRALGAASSADVPAKPAAGNPAELPLPAAPARPASPHPPPPAPADPSPARFAAPVAEQVPFLEDRPEKGAALRRAAPGGPDPALPPAAAATLPPTAPVTADQHAPDPPEVAPTPLRLARGLASFSRDNAEREKKFAHLIRDAPSDGGDGEGSAGSRRRR